MTFYEWKQSVAARRSQDLNRQYELCRQTFKNLILDELIEDFNLGDRIQEEEIRLIHDLESTLGKLWNLQKEKKVVADGKLFDPKMLNSRCLPIIDKLMAKSNGVPKVDIQVLEDTDKSGGNDEFQISSEWTGTWSSLEENV